LAERTGKDRHNITRILNLLEKKYLTRRVPDPDDRRRRSDPKGPSGSGTDTQTHLKKFGRYPQGLKVPVILSS
jgi:hypothetical protein